MAFGNWRAARRRSVWRFLIERRLRVADRRDGRAAFRIWPDQSPSRKDPKQRQSCDAELPKCPEFRRQTELEKRRYMGNENTLEHIRTYYNVYSHNLMILIYILFIFRT